MKLFSGFSDPNGDPDCRPVGYRRWHKLRTRVATKMGAWLVSVAGNSETKMLIYLMLTVAGLGAFARLHRGGRHFHPGGT